MSDGAQRRPGRCIHRQVMACLGTLGLACPYIEIPHILESKYLEVDSLLNAEGNYDLAKQVQAFNADMPAPL